MMFCPARGGANCDFQAFFWCCKSIIYNYLGWLLSRLDMMVFDRKFRVVLVRRPNYRKDRSSDFPSTTSFLGSYTPLSCFNLRSRHLFSLTLSLGYLMYLTVSNDHTYSNIIDPCPYLATILLTLLVFTFPCTVSSYSGISQIGINLQL